jgi:hypothetical protein
MEPKLILQSPKPYLDAAIRRGASGEGIRYALSKRMQCRPITFSVVRIQLDNRARAYPLFAIPVSPVAYNCGVPTFP